MRQYATTIGIALVTSAAVSLAVALTVKPAPIVPQTTVISRGAIVPGTAGSLQTTRAEQRAIATAWGDLAQPEVDALTAALKAIAPAPLVIFCQADEKCGDMALDFENAFESAKWKEVRQEAPLIDDTFGVAASREDLVKAINDATSGRLKAKLIAKNAPYEVVVIGKKPRA